MAAKVVLFVVSTVLVQNACSQCLNSLTGLNGLNYEAGATSSGTGALSGYFNNEYYSKAFNFLNNGVAYQGDGVGYVQVVELGTGISNLGVNSPGLYGNNVLGYKDFIPCNAYSQSLNSLTGLNDLGYNGLSYEAGATSSGIGALSGYFNNEYYSKAFNFLNNGVTYQGDGVGYVQVVELGTGTSNIGVNAPGLYGNNVLSYDGFIPCNTYSQGLNSLTGYKGLGCSGLSYEAEAISSGIGALSGYFNNEYYSKDFNFLNNGVVYQGDGVGKGPVAYTGIPNLGVDSLGLYGNNVVGLGCNGVYPDLVGFPDLGSIGSSGPLFVTSISPIGPSGLAVASEIEIAGNLLVTGTLPFLSALSFEGALPTAGSGVATCGCGNGAVGIVNDGFPGTIGGCGCGASTLYPDNFYGRIY